MAQRTAIRHICDLERRRVIDLLPDRTPATVEKEFQGFVADILLGVENDEILLIEVAVSHPCSPEKTASGRKIIEIHVESDTDIARLRNGFWLDGEKSVGYNRRPEPESKTTNSRECSDEAAAFIIFQSGKVVLRRNFADQVVKTMQRVSVMYAEPVDPRDFQQTDPLAQPANISILYRCVQKAAFEVGHSFKRGSHFTVREDHCRSP